MGQEDKKTTGQQVETQHFASDDLDRNREYHYETIYKCWHCKGTGKVAVEQVQPSTFSSKFAKRLYLLSQHQKEKTCSICNGSGRLRKKKTVVINLEPYFEK